MKVFDYAEYNKVSGVYCIENTISNMKYVGATSDLYKRATRHICALNISSKKTANRHLRKDWVFYGADYFKIYALEICDSHKLKEREQFWLDKINPIYPLGYNIRLVVDSNAGLPGYWTGKKLSAETSIKMSVSKKALKLKSPQATKMGLYGSNNELLATYDSMMEAASKLNISVCGISRSVTLNYKTRHGVWKKLI